MEVGDLVYLKSGSPAMTVTLKEAPRKDGAAMAMVQWTAGSVLMSATLPEAVLVGDDPTPAIEVAREKNIEAQRAEPVEAVKV